MAAMFKSLIGKKSGILNKKQGRTYISTLF